MISKVAKLILFKDKSYLEIDSLKEKFKIYSELSDEIRMLEDKLSELDNKNLEHKKHMKDINEYLKVVDLLKNKLDKINKSIVVENYNILNECITLLKNIKINSKEDSLKYDILNRIDDLKIQLDTVQWELEVIILDYAIKNLDIDFSEYNEDLFNYLCDEIEKYLTNKNNEKTDM